MRQNSNVDYFLWRALKAVSYATPAEYELDLVEKFTCTAGNIQENPWVLNLDAGDAGYEGNLLQGQRIGNLSVWVNGDDSFQPIGMDSGFMDAGDASYEGNLLQGQRIGNLSVRVNGDDSFQPICMDSGFMDTGDASYEGNLLQGQRIGNLSVWVDGDDSFQPICMDSGFMVSVREVFKLRR
ncbi:hypothetical protein CDAR_16141 [Caerostris darwini]|uniref:Uncharacterized protein n=1 Tax=Caerostris darwini TaxID=1538125 RepID=A0AAV4USP1_9ARAC|nr:hypothetical protein CDAR_16141 [Caerostris darwini]